jgi:hypothetical protein
MEKHKKELDHILDSVFEGSKSLEVETANGTKTSHA